MELVAVKRFQFLINNELDQALERLAAERRKSKAALIRQFLRERLYPQSSLSADPLVHIVGVDGFEPSVIDPVVYR
jgi:hypothetical protein